MSRTVRFAATLLILVSLTCGSLGALPFGPRIVPAENGRGDFLTAVVQWIASLFAPDPATDDPPKPPPYTKEGSGYDPHGGPH